MDHIELLLFKSLCGSKISLICKSSFTWRLKFLFALLNQNWCQMQMQMGVTGCQHCYFFTDWYKGVKIAECFATIAGLTMVWHFYWQYILRNSVSFDSVDGMFNMDGKVATSFVHLHSLLNCRHLSFNSCTRWNTEYTIP